MDSTIPANGRRRRAGPSSGRLIARGDNIVLVDADGDRWSQDVVNICSSFWGGTSEGQRKLPRPWRYDETTGALIEHGDIVVIDFLNGDPRKPLIRGTVQQLSGSYPDDDGWLPSSYGEVSPNVFRTRVQPRTAGQVEHTVQAELGGEQMYVKSTSTLLVEVGPIGAPKATLLMEPDGTITINGESVLLGVNTEALAEQLIRGKTFQTSYNGHTHVCPAGTSGVPTPLMLDDDLTSTTKAG